MEKLTTSPGKNRNGSSLWCCFEWMRLFWFWFYWYYFVLILYFLPFFFLLDKLWLLLLLLLFYCSFSQNVLFQFDWQQYRCFNCLLIGPVLKEVGVSVDCFCFLFYFWCKSGKKRLRWYWIKTIKILVSRSPVLL